MMLSDFIALVRGYVMLPIGVVAVMVFIFTAIAVVVYRVTSGIDGVLVRAGVFTFALLFLTNGMEQGHGLEEIGLWLAVFAGVSVSTYERLIG